MNTPNKMNIPELLEIETKIEQFRQSRADLVSRREDLTLNAPDLEMAIIYGESHDLAREIEREFTRTFSTEPTVETDE
jgi:hypothetical protein